MKHILVPIRVFETGDRVLTPSGKATIVHDEMEDFDRTHAATLSCSLESPAVDKVIEAAQYRAGVIVELDHPDKEGCVEVVMGRDLLILTSKES